MKSWRDIRFSSILPQELQQYSFTRLRSCVRNRILKWDSEKGWWHVRSPSLLQTGLYHLLLCWYTIPTNGLDSFSVEHWFSVVRVLKLEAYIPLLSQQDTWKIDLLSIEYNEHCARTGIGARLPSRIWVWRELGSLKWLCQRCLAQFERLVLSFSQLDKRKQNRYLRTRLLLPIF